MVKIFEPTKLPTQIEEDMELDQNYTQRPNIFHVSELSYDCMFKAFLDRKEGKGFNKDALWNIYRGTIFDRYLTKLFDENEVRVQHRIKGTPYVVRGRIDGILYEENEIWEIKTVASSKFVRNPYNHHIKQGLFYLCTYDPTAKLKFLYASMDGHKEFEYVADRETADQVLMEYEEKARMLGDGIKKDEPPEPTRGSQCNWCRYKEEGKCPICKPRKKRAKKE